MDIILDNLRGMDIKLDNLREMDGNMIFLLSGALIFLTYTMILIFEVLRDIFAITYNFFFPRNNLENIDSRLCRDFITRYRYDDTFVDILKESFYLERKMNVGDMVEVLSDAWFGKCGYVTKLNDDETLNIRVPKYLNDGKVPKNVITRNYRDLKYFKLT
tara:strand:- start:720 stop:1199 length:480 start_codon:yes stop_codon:yes gene_type:complete